MRKSVGPFEKFSQKVSEWAGSTTAFVVAFGVIVVWAVSGPLFHFSDTWQLVINTGTTIVTFLMVFLIQRAQNKDAKAVALKLNELIAALKGASSHLINAEDLGERELDILHRHYEKLARLAKEDADLTRSHSIEEATARHRRKQPGRASDADDPDARDPDARAADARDPDARAADARPTAPLMAASRSSSTPEGR